MKNKINVSAAIRSFIGFNPTMGPKEVAEKVSKQIGKKVSPTYVSNIKNLVANGSGKVTTKRKYTKVKAVPFISASNVQLPKDIFALAKQQFQTLDSEIKERETRREEWKRIMDAGELMKTTKE